MNKLKIQYMPLDEIVPNERNPKFHDVDAIRESYKRFGYADAIVRDDRTGKLAAGHGRCEVLASLHAAGEPAPAGIEVRAGRWYVPVQIGWASRDDREAEAFLVASNRITETGGWDMPATLEILSSLDSLAGTGWDAAELERQTWSLDDINSADLDESDPAGAYKEQYAVIVICADEAEQEKIYNELTGKGYTTRVVTT